jgi:peptidoglycan/xylan/chitin deacetylase (PgdA/CDA1 family)
VAWLGPGLAPHAPPVASLLGIRRRLPVDGVVLTFDDGPHPEGTPAVLEALGAVPAVFFLVGEQVERHPQLAAEIVAAGHEVALHGHRHRNQMRVTPAALRDDLRRGVNAIGEATGRAPALYRPPYGIFTPAGLAIARGAGWLPLLWSTWGRDWRARVTPAEIARLATRDLRRGDVVLLHDADWYSSAGSHRRTAAALPRILEAIERGGLYPTGSASASAGALTHST